MILFLWWFSRTIVSPIAFTTPLLIQFRGLLRKSKLSTNFSFDVSPRFAIFLPSIERQIIIEPVISLVFVPHGFLISIRFLAYVRSRQYTLLCWTGGLWYSPDVARGMTRWINQDCTTTVRCSRKDSALTPDPQRASKPGRRR